MIGDTATETSEAEEFDASLKEVDGIGIAPGSADHKCPPRRHHPALWQVGHDTHRLELVVRMPLAPPPQEQDSAPAVRPDGSFELERIPESVPAT